MQERSGEQVRVVEHQRRVSPGYTLGRIIYSVLSVAIVILAFRFGLRLFGANPEAGFVEFVYRLSAPLVAPFEAVFPTTALDRAVFEWNSLLAMVVYSVLAWGVTSLLLSLTGGRASTRVVEQVHEERSTRRSDAE